LWVEVGWTHPLAGQIQVAAGQMLLLRPPAEWTAIADAPFCDIYELLDVRLPGQPVAWDDSPPADKLSIALRFAPAPPEPAGLWVLRGDAVEQIDTLVRDADARTLAGFAIAVGEAGGERIAVLRARPKSRRDTAGGSPPVPQLDGALACRSYLRLPHLYLPVGKRLRPPLRRDAVRRLLADDPDRVVWLQPQSDDSFMPESLPESAFRPLADWVEFVIERDAADLTAWAAAARFEFAAFVGTQKDLTRPTPRPQRGRGEKATKPSPPSSPGKGAGGLGSSSPAPATPPETFAIEPSAPPSELQVRLRAAEERFLAVDGPLDDPRRLALWPELARLNGLLGHKADAGLAWANALWESADPPAAWSGHWVEAEEAQPKQTLTDADLDRLLASPKPTGADVRPLAAALVWAGRQKPAPDALLRRLPDVQRYFERHDHLLPVRVAWLAWYALTHLGGPDVLTLARVRDRMLERLLAEGLVAERDLPGFLRFAGQPEGDRLRLVRERAERLRQLIHQWSGFASGDGLQQTPSYIDLLFAFGFARLGEIGAARSLVQQASAALAASGSEAHTFLLEAFRYRIEQAINAQPHAGPLPQEQLEYLAQMHADFDRQPNSPQQRCAYAVERMRKESQILEPHEKFEAYRYTNPDQEPLVRELHRLGDVFDRAKITQAVRQILTKTPRTRESGLRVLAESLTLANRAGEAFATELLARVGPALDAAGPADSHSIETHALLLERALLFAAHYDLPKLVRALSDRLDDLLNAPAGRPALDPLGRLVGQSLRSLRKLGLNDLTERLLDEIARAALRGQSLDQARARAGLDWQPSLRLLLHVAAGWLCFNRAAEARPILDAARAWILSPDKRPNDPARSVDHYVRLVAAYIAAAGQGPQDEAFGRIEELFAPGRMDRLSDTYTTSGFYSRLHLSVAEAVVLTLATEDFALGPAARRWLDDDEFLVRRRIHRDVRAALAGAGM
jgi:hypothetical protein